MVQLGTFARFKPLKIALMASSLSIVNIVLLLSYFLGMIMWTCGQDASSRDTLKPGDTLNASSLLLSASGKFTLSFFVPEDGSGTSYLAIMRKKYDPNQAWIGNRETPILDPPSAVLTLDSNNTLKISYQGGHPIVICSAPKTTSTNSVVVATILDSGNLVLQEVNSMDGSMMRVWWQSFDYPADTFLPGMKLGFNHSNGYIWSLTSWIAHKNASRGLYTLDWHPKARQLELRRRGVLYWTSGNFIASKRRFEFILPDESKVRYNFSIVSDEHEDSVTYTGADVQISDEPEWVLNALGRLYDYDGEYVEIARADNCDGYSTRRGCQRRDRADDCMPNIDSADDAFEFKTGYFKPINSSNTTSRCPYWLNLASDKRYSASTDCKPTCWQNCDCLGFDFPFGNQTTSTAAGCRFWSVDCEFIEDLTGGSGTTPSYVVVTGLGLISPAKLSSGKNMGHNWIWIGTAIVTALVLLCVLYYLHRRRSLASSVGEHRRTIQNELLTFMKSKTPTGNVDGLQDDEKMGHDLSVFSYASVLAATCDFSEENKLGEGGFGPVYKGKLVTGQEIAVKRLSYCSKQGVSEFKNELILISELQHTNLVQLFGFCIHGEERMLIYEYLPNKSLDNFLFERTDSTRGRLLDWKKRFCIIEGIAQGLLYLHKYSRVRVVHRDLKASNILLDGNMNPKISDFGMARIFTDNERQVNTNRIVGTYGYMSPEYAMQGIFSTKSDVYSFGVLMLEIISGRRNSSFYNDDSVLNIVGYAWKLWKEGEGLGLMDPTLGDSCVADQLLRCIHVALLCVEESASARPTMFDVISMLSNESLLLPIPTKPAFCSGKNVAKASISEEGQEQLSSDGAFTYTSFCGR